MNLVLLNLILIFDLIVIYLLTNKDILNPAFLFTAGFFLATVDLIIMAREWDVSLNLNTVLLVGLSPLFFLAGSLLAINTRKSRFTKYKIVVAKTSIFNNQSIDNILEKNTKVLGFFLLFNTVIVILYSLEIIRTMISYGFGGNAFTLFFRYGEIQKNLREGEAYVGGLIRTLYLIVTYLGYVWAYMLAYSLNKYRRANKKLVLCFATSVFATLVEGTRGRALYLIIGTVLMLLVFEKKSSRLKKIKTKTIIKVIMVILLLAVGFNFYITIAGVNTNISNPFEYISIYLGAPTINLNTILSKDIESSNYFGGYTFTRIYSWIADRTTFNYQADSQIEFNYINNRGYGNVFSIYRSLVQDFGYIGTYIFVLIMGFFTVKLYKKTLLSDDSLNIYGIVYLYIIPLIVLSFFSNKFSEGVLTISFVYFIFFCLLAKFLLEHRFRN